MLMLPNCQRGTAGSYIIIKENDCIKDERGVVLLSLYTSTTSNSTTSTSNYDKLQQQEESPQPFPHFVF
jgi:hypothetical protein